MRIAALISGGKDSIFAAHKASKENKLVCLIALKSKNPDSYMFHTPNIELVKLQAEAMELPLIFLETEGVKEKELDDLRNAIAVAKQKYKIEAVVSGAVESNYQKSRIENVCLGLSLNSITPIWHINHDLYLKELFRDFEVIITGIAADGLQEDDLGKRFDLAFLEKIKNLKLSKIGEGGEFETLVLYCPSFKKRIHIKKSRKVMSGSFSGRLQIESAGLN